MTSTSFAAPVAPHTSKIVKNGLYVFERGENLLQNHQCKKKVSVYLIYFIEQNCKRLLFKAFRSKDIAFQVSSFL